MCYKKKKKLLWLLAFLILVKIVLFKLSHHQLICFFRNKTFISTHKDKVVEYSREMPLIFIGGFPRSGTTLMRAMLDSHPDIRCGQETRVLSHILKMYVSLVNSKDELLQIQKAGVTRQVMNSAMAHFFLEIIVKHGYTAPRFCNKDPMIIKMGSYLIQLFPNAKFLFMVRDGRASVHSVISRKINITGLDRTSYRRSLIKWNETISAMYDQCKKIGKNQCMMVYYEQLVLHPKDCMEKILSFLDIPWNNAVLQHEKFINKSNGVSISRVEISSDQIVKPVNLEALTKWVGHIPKNVEHDMARIAPMLTVLGYDPNSSSPFYGKPDDLVKKNTFHVLVNRKYWEDKAKELFRKQK